MTPRTAARQSSLSFTISRVCSDLHPLSRWCHPTISSSVTLYFSCPQSLPASGSFPMSWLFASGGQSIGASASASVLLMHIQCWFPLVLIGSFLYPLLNNLSLTKELFSVRNIEWIVFPIKPRISSLIPSHFLGIHAICTLKGQCCAYWIIYFTYW